MKYMDKDILTVFLKIQKSKGSIVLDGKHLNIADIIQVSRKNKKVSITKDPKTLKLIEKTYQTMMDDIKNGVPVYGCNSAYGGRAGVVLNKGDIEKRIKNAQKISEAIIHTDVTVGPELDVPITKGAILIRANMLVKGVSAVRQSDIELYIKLLNKNITPIVNQYGGVGASGDLAHNSRVLSALRWIEGTKIRQLDGSVIEAKDALKSEGIEQLKLEPKAGLGLVNGDNFSTSIAASIAYDTLSLFILSLITSAMVVEALNGTNRSFHPLLGKVRQHKGQINVANIMMYLLNDSKLAYQEEYEHKKRKEGELIQDGYSLRGIAQYYAIGAETLIRSLETITINANSASDNPLWVTPEYAINKKDEWNWVSGANFIAMHMSETLDSLRKTLTHIAKISDRHIARLVKPHQNNGLPANLSDPKAISQCTFKGVQIQAGMLDIYSSLLSIPVNTFFGNHEEDNQDITSHAITSGILAKENLRVARYAVAQTMLAAVQAIDIRGGPELLSPQTRPLYDFIREKTNYVKEERPISNDIETIYKSVEDESIIDVINKIISKYKE